MAFAATARVRVSDQRFHDRGLLGTVIVAAADDPNGLNQVRLDGQQSDQTSPYLDSQLAAVGETCPVTY